ncbi:MAG: branched-chain amino acid aminotransferase [Arenicellales bacterium]
MAKTSNISVTLIEKSAHAETAFDNLGFGDAFSDHMLLCDWADGKWNAPRIVPREPLKVDPAALGLHYGQSVFEGLKAYRGTADNRIRLFRPDRNAQRLATSCNRLCIPAPDGDQLIDWISSLVAVEAKWVPANFGEALYIRPMIFATEGHLAVRPANRYTLVIVAAPVGQYFAKYGRPLRVKAEDRYTRAASGGTGAAKTAGNYGATLKPMFEAASEGFDQILWLDGNEHAFAEEAGQMNIFFRIGNEVVTPELSGTILPGVTRDSVLSLLEQWGIKATARRISMAELRKAAESETLLEIFGAGTAAVVVPVESIQYQDLDIRACPPSANSLSQRLFHSLLAIQHGQVDDANNWIHFVDTE